MLEIDSSLRASQAEEFSNYGRKRTTSTSFAGCPWLQWSMNESRSKATKMVRIVCWFKLNFLITLVSFGKAQKQERHVGKVDQTHGTDSNDRSSLQTEQVSSNLRYRWEMGRAVARAYNISKHACRIGFNRSQVDSNSAVWCSQSLVRVLSWNHMERKSRQISVFIMDGNKIPA